MKISFDWLSDYVDLSGITPYQLAEKLTMGAFEVEEVVTVGADLQGPIVIGEILEIHPHPNADKIRLTKTRVEVGAEPLDIVCGASNIAPGQIVPVALPGARVIDRKSGGPLLIKASPIRGVQSNGMLCSPAELGIDGADPEAGILVIEREAGLSKIGQDARSVLSLQSDYVLQVEPRSNRGDALSVIGLAREVAALFQRKLKQPDWSLDDLSKSEAEKFNISIENEHDCAFFSLRQIDNLAPGKVPDFIAKRLAAIGVRTVSPIVDITNYVMHECGQPLHAYDLSALTSNGSSGLAPISIRRAKEEEVVETLDGKKRLLTPEVLVVADQSKVLAIAGVMGSKDSEINDRTTSVVLEAASFSQARVRRGSRLLGLSTEASLRFERGVDPSSVRKAADRAAFLIAKYCTKEENAKSLGVLSTAGSEYIESKQVVLRLGQIKRILGVQLDAEQVKALLAPLGFSVVTVSADKMTLSVPSFRQSDVIREIDLVEEVCRLWGYDRIPETMPASTLAAMPADQTPQKLRSTLAAWGFSEAWLSSLTGSTQALAGYGVASDPVRVLNPLSVEHQVLRQSLLPGLIQAAVYNYSRGRKKIWLFEMGRIYLRSSESGFGTGVIEPEMLSAILVGNPEETNWQGNSIDLDLYRLKGYLENLFSILQIGIEKVRFNQAQGVEDIWHPGRTVEITFSHKPLSLSDDQAVWLGRFGALHPRLCDQHEIRVPAYMFELSLDAIQLVVRPKGFKEVANTPAVFRDITADLMPTVSFSAFKGCIQSEAGSSLQDAQLVSTFKPVGENKSLSVRLRFQHPDKTLTAEEVDVLVDKIKAGLAKKLGATYR